MFRQTYSYSDIGLIPTQCSSIKSRDDVDTSTDFLGFKLEMPILTAPMESVSGPSMSWAIEKLGGLTVLPRTNSLDIDIQNFNKSSPQSIPSVSLTTSKSLLQSIPTAVCIDVANGFSTGVEEIVRWIKSDPELKYLKIITGNVGSVEGYEFLANLGVDAVRVNIGTGSVCTTANATAVTAGSATLIREVADFKERALNNNGPLIIADGGISSARDICISLALGADVVMCGKVFASCTESPGEVITFNGKEYKKHAGQASHAVKRNNRYVEGRETLVEHTGPVADTWHRFEDGLRSSMSYMNCKNIEEFKYLPNENFCLLPKK